MTITQALRGHLTKSFNLPAEASDADAQALALDKIASGEMDVKTVRELTASADSARFRELVATEVKSAVGSFKDEILSAIRGSDSVATMVGQVAAKAEAVDATKAAAELATKAASLNGGAASPAAVLAAGVGTGDVESESRIRVKSVVEQFDNTRTGVNYGMSKNPYLQKNYGASKPVYTAEVGSEGARALDLPTARSKAIAGAWLKFMLSKNSNPASIPANCRMTELDKQLVQYALHECRFVGAIGAHDDDRIDACKAMLNDQKMPELWVKALLDDATSGGLEAVPIEFDDAAIITPLLNGELFPLVKTRTVTRRRIEGFSVGNPTLSWGVSEGSDIPLFNTDSFVAAFDTTIYPVSGAIESGLDFEADAPVAIGDIITQRYGERFLKEMDKVIANGNGTNQPLGVFGTSGAGSPSVENTTTGPPTVTDYEALLFAVAKEYRDQATKASQVFIANETSYSRARGVKVGTSDQRRVFGMSHEDYMLLGHPYKVEQSLANGSIAFANLSYYRLYRRQGFQVRVVTEDATLARQNKRLIVVRARVGGQMELGGACAFVTNAQS